jgi:pimeloyl-ACP methyl ester carboxylesterase
MKKLIPLVLGRYLNTLTRVAPRIAGKTGFKIFCYPFRTPIQPHQRAFLSSANRTVLPLGKEAVQVYRWGNGTKKLLFLHGWQSHSFRWKNYVDALSKQYTIYAFDAPGHGLSTGNFLTVPLYSTAIEKLIADIGEVDTVVAHSLGAFTALHTLHRSPSLPIKKMVLLASPGEATEFFQFYQQTLKLSDQTVSNIVLHFEEVIHQKVNYFSAPAFAAAIPLPGLLIHDEDDEDTSFHHSIAIHKAWKNSQLILTKGLGHNLRSPEIVKTVVEFIEEHKPAVKGLMWAE